MNDEDSVDIAQYVVVVDIAVSVHFGLDTHVRVIWYRVVPHVSHTVIQVLAENLSGTLQAI